MVRLAHHHYDIPMLFIIGWNENAFKRDAFSTRKASFAFAIYDVLEVIMIYMPQYHLLSRHLINDEGKFQMIFLRFQVQS